MRTTFVFHSITIYNPWTWKQSEDPLNISLTPKRSEFTDVQKLFLLRHDIGDKIDHYILSRVFFLCEATKGAGDWRNYRLTRPWFCFPYLFTLAHLHIFWARFFRLQALHSPRMHDPAVFAHFEFCGSDVSRTLSAFHVSRKILCFKKPKQNCNDS